MKIMRQWIMLAAVLAAGGMLISSCGGGGVSVTGGQSAQVQTHEQEYPQLVDAPEAMAAIAAAARGEFPFDDDEILNDTQEPMAQSMRKMQQVPPEGASGGPDMNSYYIPSKAFDGDYRSWWAGKTGAKKWDLYYAFQQSHHLDFINVNFYGPDYIPDKLDVYVSADGVQWDRVAHLINHKKQPLDPFVAIGREVRFIWIDMQGNPKIGFPLVRDIEWQPIAERVGAYATPGQNDNWYFASNAFDADPETLWAGLQGAGEWTMFYGFPQARFIGVVAVDIFSVNHRPADMELFTSNDGKEWTSHGSFGSVWPPKKFAGEVCKYFKIVMTGNPPSGFPVIRTITYNLPAGAFAKPNENSYYAAANAFDGVPNTWWVGLKMAGAWDLYYGFESPRAVGIVTVNYYSVNHMPASTELFTSNDGVTWSSAGMMPTGASPSLALNASVKYLRFSMKGNPYVGYPLVKDVAIQ